MLHELFTRTRFLFARNRRGETADEIGFHLEQLTQANVAAGMAPEEARRRARLAFGGVERVREECHEQSPRWRMGVVGQDARYALRGFRRSPVLTITVIATLALGIGTTTAVFSVVDPILFRSLPYADVDRLVSVGMAQSLEPHEFTLGSFYYDWRANQRPFEALTSEGAVTQECDLTDRKAAQLYCARTEANFLPTLGVSPVLGRNFLPEEDRPHGPHVALISYGLWVNHYSRDPGILNKLIEIDGNPVRVIGVLPKDFEMPDLQAADVILPLALNEATQHSANQGLGVPMRTFARLKPGVSLKQAQAELEPLYPYATIPSAFRKDFRIRVRYLRDRQMQDLLLIAWVLFGAVLAMLLIACANVASLLMARAATRERELAVRSALGASRARLVFQALTEALLLSSAGALVGLCLAEALLRVFIAIAPTGIPFLSKAHLDLRIILFTVVIAMACGVLFSLAAALQNPNAQMLAGRSSAVISHAGVRRWLVVLQIAASMVLLAGGTLLLRSFWNMRNQHLGIQTENTVAVSVSLGERNYSLPAQRIAFFQQLERRLQFGPGVSSLAVSNSLPPGEGDHAFYSTLVVSGKPPSIGRTGGLITSRLISPGYFRVLNIAMLRGEDFTEQEQDSNQNLVILSKQLADRLFPGKNPIGEHLQLDNLQPNTAWYTVVGVAADVKNGGLTGEQEPEYYRLRLNRPEDWENLDKNAVIVVKTSLPLRSISPWIESQVEALDPTVLVNVETLQQRVSKMAAQPEFETSLVGFFAATGLVLAIIGLYGVVSFVTAQRTREIGVRMALGATKLDVLKLIVWEGGRLILLGGALGLCGALAISRVIRSLLFNVGPHDPMSYVGVALLLACIALVAILIPARTAIEVDPMMALRCE